MIERSPSTQDFQKRLKFTFKKKYPDNENYECLKTGFDPSLVDKVTIDAYVITEPGKKAKIPKTLQSLPCYVIQKTPEIVETAPIARLMF